MFARIGTLCLAALVAGIFNLSVATAGAAESDGVVRVESAYSIDETVARLKDDIAAKGIRFFFEVDQSQLAAEANVDMHPSRLLVFGNPPLGTQFLTSNPVSGLDWPVRLLVFEDAEGKVWMAYTDFGWIAVRHHIDDREAQFKMASMVIESITSSARLP